MDVLPGGGERGAAAVEHGVWGDHTAWAFQIGALSARYRVIAFDNRGVGRTDVPDHPYTTRMMARDSLGLMDALGIDRVHVIGVSMGGMIPQERALAHPERVRSPHLGCTLARPDAYMLALNAAGRDMRDGLGREATLRTLALWLFAPATYTERPDLLETLLQNSLANPYPQSLTGFLRQGEAVAAHDARDGSRPSGARRWSASPRTTSSCPRASPGKSRRRFPPPSSAWSPARRTAISWSPRGVQRALPRLPGAILLPPSLVARREIEERLGSVNRGCSSAGFASASVPGDGLRG
ncbi:MAG: hypothetical protein DMD99_25280 [Candidatus Rokuibacteriota bacterium]|nr:MAG: hypothetical protein DMD99_25280 [Candidatus Rokubacteria bacterium]